VTNDRKGGLDEKERNDKGWVKVGKGSKIIKTAAPYYLELNNSYATLEKVSAKPGPPHTIDKHTGNSVAPEVEGSTFQAKVAERKRSRAASHATIMHAEGIINRYANLAEDERTAMAK
jgi:hypothetical protein